MVHIHGFNWASYSTNVMPAFARWLINEEEQGAYQLYKETRHAREEQFVPEAIQPLCAWPRAKEFVHQLPRGPFARREYQKLCVAEQFLLLSDRYVYRHPPQLYRDSEALRTVWGASIEEHCLPWYHQLQKNQVQEKEERASPLADFTTDKNELLDLLQTAGLHTLAEEMNGQPSEREQPPKDEEALAEEAFPEDEDEDEDGKTDGPQGIFIGRQPTTLQMRGWLATQSVRAMVFFEYLACGRRYMPFGYQEGDPFGAYIGYLTPEEVHLLLDSLANVDAPSQSEAENDYRTFRQQRSGSSLPFRLIDELLPTHASEFLQAVRTAAGEQLGLICTTE
jgi:hypothetical protein